MNTCTSRRRRAAVAAAAALSLLATPLLTAPADAADGADGARVRPKAPAVRVMTRNLYLGADIMRPIQAIQRAKAEHPGDQLAQLDAFANANEATFKIVDDTNFPLRAQLLASEIAAQRPDLVGMQEVAWWRTGPMDFPSPQSPDFLAPNAPDTKYDFLRLLLDALSAKGVEYKAISVKKRADVEGPAYEGTFTSAPTKRDVRLTMRDVVLRRADSDVRVVKGSKGNQIYAQNLEFDLDDDETTDNAISFDRGFQWVDLARGGHRFRFVNTHLESFSSDLAFAQAHELVAGAAGDKITTILTCDCNSDPLNGSVKTGIGDTKRHWDPYYLLLRSGLNDTWLQRYAPQDGWTSGLSETVDDAEASGFDHRIDLVLARTANGDKLRVLSGAVVGNEVTDRDAATGLWPSDHAGVVMKLRLR